MARDFLIAAGFSGITSKVLFAASVERLSFLQTRVFQKVWVHALIGEILPPWVKSTFSVSLTLLKNWLRLDTLADWGEAMDLSSHDIPLVGGLLHALCLME